MSILLLSAVSSFSYADTCNKPEDEAKNRLGANRCAGNCECTGERTCSSFGWCQGNSGENHSAESPTPSHIPLFTYIPAPCIPKKEEQIRRQSNNPSLLTTCSALFSDKNNLKFSRNFYSFFRSKIDCLYKGHSIDLATTPVGQSACSNEPHKKRVTCSINDGEGENDASESKKNNLGETCGDINKGNGSWENSQLSGLIVQAMKYYRDQVMKEILTTKKLKLTSAMCQSQSEYYQDIFYFAKETSDALVRNFSPKARKAALNSNACSLGAIAKKGNEFAGESSTGQLASCYLNGAAGHLTQIFSYLAECEVLRRTEGFKAKFLDTDSKSITKIMSDCVSKGILTALLKDDVDAGMSEAAKCYKRDIQDFFKTTVSSNISGKFDNNPPLSNSDESKDDSANDSTTGDSTENSLMAHPQVTHETL